MERWTNVLTEAGAAALAGIPGKTFNFSRVKCGSTHVDAAELPALTDIPGYQKDFSITSHESGNGISKLRIQLTNDGVDDDFCLYTVGIFGRVGDGPETLIRVLGLDVPDPIPSLANCPNYVYDLVINIAIGNASEITATVDPAAYITAGQIYDGDTVEALSDIDSIPLASGKTLKNIRWSKLKQLLKDLFYTKEESDTLLEEKPEIVIGSIAPTKGPALWFCTDKSWRPDNDDDDTTVAMAELGDPEDAEDADATAEINGVQYPINDTEVTEENGQVTATIQGV